ncbi:MAG: DUF1674 domain-containing protein, partial [Pseudomonadota bacterium]
MNININIEKFDNDNYSEEEMNVQNIGEHHSDNEIDENQNDDSSNSDDSEENTVNFGEEIGGRKGRDPLRYGDWEVKG